MTTETIDEFEAAFAEANVGKPKTEGAPTDESAQAPAPSPATAPAPAAEAPAPAPKAAGPAPAPAPTPAQPDKQPTFDELKAELEATRQRERSSAGRVSVFMQENQKLKGVVDELSKKVAEIAAASQAAAKPAPAPAPAEPDVLDGAPDLKAAVEKRISGVKAEMQSTIDKLQTEVKQTQQAAETVQQTVEPLRRRSVEATILETHKALDERFTPVWRETVRSEQFKEWLSLEENAYFADLYRTAPTATESGKVVAMYYAEKGAPPAPAPAPAATPAAATTQRPGADALRLAAGIAPKGGARAPAAPAQDDFEASFNEFAGKVKTA